MKRAEFYMSPGTHIPSALYGATLVGVLTKHKAGKIDRPLCPVEPPAEHLGSWRDVERGIIEARRLIAEYGRRTAKRIAARAVDRLGKRWRCGSIGNAACSGQAPIGSVRASFRRFEVIA